MASLVADVTGIAINTPLGVVLVTQSDPGVRVAGVTLLLHAGNEILSLLLSDLGSSDMEALREHFEARLAAGGAPAVAVVETEKKWEEEATRGRGGRLLWAIGDLVFGTGEAALGTYILLADSVVDMSRSEQNVWGALLIGVGIPAVVGGVARLAFGSSSLESWWQIYQAGKPVAPRAESWAPSFGVVPVRGGATGVMQVVF